MCGVDPSAQVDRLEQYTVDPNSPLLTAARPVLRKMVEELGDAPLAVLLAGRDGLVLDVLTAENRGQLADMARTRIGRRCTEELVGTNSIGTALELGRGVQIRGDEHYLESLRSLNCLGVPVENPISGRTEGVLSICGERSTVNAGLGPFLSYAARDIRERLLGAIWNCWGCSRWRAADMVRWWCSDRIWCSPAPRRRPCWNPSITPRCASGHVIWGATVCCARSPWSSPRAGP
jgi:transcriptional regulator of acetoin/glycerol metabolism